MANLVLKDGTVLLYDESSNKVIVNGKEDGNWSPSFIPSGSDESPDFFGFINRKTNTCYDIYGGIRPISDVNKIKL